MFWIFHRKPARFFQRRPPELHLSVMDVDARKENKLVSVKKSLDFNMEYLMVLSRGSRMRIEQDETVRLARK